MRQVSACMDRINVRTHNDMAFQVNIRGPKRPIPYKTGPSERKRQENVLDEDQTRKADEAMLRAIARKRWQRKT